MRRQLADSEAAAERARHDLEAAQKELQDTRGRLETAKAVQDELRGRCEELALASGAFAAEVAKQKEERSKLEESSRQAAEASAAELREQCAELSRASEASAAECRRLEKELAKARAEAQEVDDDVAQVLNALASSEKERRRLVQEIDLQSRIAAAARGAAKHVREDVDRERAALCEKAGQLEGAVQASASKLQESLETETKRREHLEQERKRLASRVTELEAALISATAEVRKAAKLAAERADEHDRNAAALNEEITKLKESVRQCSKRAAEERRKWEEEKSETQERATADKKAALAEAELAFQEKIAEQQRLANERELDLLDNSAARRREMADITKELEAESNRAAEALAREAASREKAARDATTLKRRVEDLESALKKATRNAFNAEDAVRDDGSPVSKTQNDVRSVISSLVEEKGEEDGVERGSVGSVSGQSTPAEEEMQSRCGKPVEMVACLARRGKGARKASVGSLRFHDEEVRTVRKEYCRKGRYSCSDGGTTEESCGVPPFAGNARSNGRSFRRIAWGSNERLASAADEKPVDSESKIGGPTSLSLTEPVARFADPPFVETASTTSPLSPSEENIAAIAEPGVGSGARSTSARQAEASGRGSGRRNRDGGTVARSGSRSGRIDRTMSNPTVSTESDWQQRGDDVAGSRIGSKTAVGGDGNAAITGEGAGRMSASPSLTETSEYYEDDFSYSTADASGVSNSLASVPLARTRSGFSRRSGNVVVRDWKAGQREAFSELDRKASSSGGGPGR